MSEAAADDPTAPSAPVSEPLAEHPERSIWRRGRCVPAVSGLVLAALLGGVWLERERIADHLIASQLQGLGLKGTYRIERIGAGRQVLRNIVIGDPRRPDLTIARAEIQLVPRLGLPAIGRVTLVQPRLYGTWTGGHVSFGSLDRLIRGGQPGKPFQLPALDLTVIDGRARVLGDHRPIGVAFEGAGGLRDGFAGTLAATAPNLVVGGCVAEQATLFGRVSVQAARPGFSGPLRFGRLGCPAAGLQLADASLQVDGRADRDLKGGEGRGSLLAGPLGLAGLNANGWNGSADATYRNGGLTARYDLIARAPAAAQLVAATASVSGVLRARGDFAHAETEGTIDARGLRPGVALDRQVSAFSRMAAGTLVVPLLNQMRGALNREAPGSRFQADYILRHGRQGTNLVLPQGQLTGRSGARLLALSRVHLATGGGAPRLAGNFTTGGGGLPSIEGRLDQGSTGQTRVTMAMADYRAGDARLAVPALTLIQDRSGALAFRGLVRASGPLPGGRAENLTVPLDGALSAGGALALWRACTTVQFDRLAYADLALDRRSLVLCPAAGGAIVTSEARGLRLAAGTPGLDLSGKLGETPIRIASGPAGFAAPGNLFARALDVTLGPAETATRFRLSDLHAEVGQSIAGTFAGADMRLNAVPLDVLDAQGHWRLAGGRLSVDDATFRLEDRAQVDRFQPLVADQASLSLAGNRLNASATLREPTMHRVVSEVTLAHDLGAGAGQADLQVPGLVFDPKLQPDMLSRELLGVVANVQGTVRGRGRIDWVGDRVTSSGRFRTDSLDLAAAFGPVKGLSGEVVFSDLLGIVTPPHQRVAIASINPGIEVTGGELLFQLKPGSIAAIEGATWPFLGGKLYLRPAQMRFGVEEQRRFVLDIEALDAARFVTQMDLANLTATGTFDGSLPLVFDQNGGRVDGGLLVSRPPGGNLSYVGALTYKDLSPVANFAFDALKSLDYRKMQIAMDGALEGEIVTRVRFDGVKQGVRAKRNFLTRRIAALPLQFNVNLRAPFYALITSFKAMYDPAYIKDPRSIGLLDAHGHPIPPSRSAAGAPGKSIQPPVSEKMP